MRDTSTLFKLCVKALLELSDEDKDVLIRLAYGLMSDDAELKPVTAVTAVTTPAPVPYDYGGEAYKGVMRERRKETKRKRKSEAKDFDPTKVLASQANKTHTPHGNETTGPKGMGADILNILRQSTGALSPIEIAELLNLKPGRVSAALCHLFLRRKYKGLTRVAGKNDSRAVYLYALNEASK